METCRSVDVQSLRLPRFPVVVVPIKDRVSATLLHQGQGGANPGDINNRALTNILVHRLEDARRHAHTIARLTWVQAAGGTVRTVRSTRASTGTRAGPNGEIGRITYRLDPRVGPLYREIAWLGVGDSGRTKLYYPLVTKLPITNALPRDAFSDAD